MTRRGIGRILDSYSNKQSRQKPGESRQQFAGRCTQCGSTFVVANNDGDMECVPCGTVMYRTPGELGYIRNGALALR